MINLNNFSKQVEAKVPIIKNTLMYNRKKYTVKDTTDGWYLVHLKDNDATVVNEIIPEVDLRIDKKKIIKGYTYNNSLVFFNFDEGRRKTGWEMLAPLRLNTLRTFTSVEAIIWEDSFLYLYRTSYSDTDIYNIKDLYETSQSIANVPKVTPEQKALYLFHQIEKEQRAAYIRRVQEEAEIAVRREKEKKSFEEAAERQKREKLSVEEGLIRSFAMVGAAIGKYEIRNNRIYVEWVLDGERFKSVVDKETYQIVEAGFCMSGDDRRHNIKSMVLTAQNYMDRDVLHKW